jgi:hypothetical protein
MMRLCNHLGKTFSVALLLAAMVAVTSARAAFINLTPTGNASNSTSSVTLADLIAGTNGIDGITVGDKNMSGFTYESLPNDDMPDPQDINVLGFKDQAGNWGITFHGAFLDLPGGGVSDAKIRFDVSIDPVALEQGYRINDAHLYLNGVGVGSPDSGFFVDESFSSDPNNPLNNTLNAHVSTFPNGTTQLSDSTIFATPLTTLHVTKDILAIAAAASGQPARATVIDQSFSQIIVPEPTCVVLSMLGLVGLIACRRNR